MKYFFALFKLDCLAKREAENAELPNIREKDKIIFLPKISFG